MNKRERSLLQRSVQELTNPYQVEIKARIMVYKLQAAKNKQLKMNVKAECTELSENNESSLLAEIDEVYREGIKKFTHSEWLLLWYGLLQLHFHQNYVLSLILCLKGISLAAHLDSQYSLYHLRQTADSLYKVHIQGDAYAYEQFETMLQSAQKSDEATTQSQFSFWDELESNRPRIKKLTKLSTEISIRSAQAN